MLFCIVLDEDYHPLHILKRQGMLGSPVLVPVHTGSYAIIQVMLDEGTQSVLENAMNVHKRDPAYAHAFEVVPGPRSLPFLLLLAF